MHSDVIALGAAKLLRLGALRDQLVGGAKDVTALRADIASAVADIRAYTSDVRAGASSMQSAAAGQVLSMAEYQRRTNDIDRRVAQSYVEENRHVTDARDVARRYGIDIFGYEQERTMLEQERDAACSKGDKLGERKADALIAQNTYNTMAGETDSITDPKERAKHLAEMEDQERIVHERRAALEEQIKLEAKRTTAEQHLSPEETGAYVAQFENEQMTEFDTRAASLKGADKMQAALATLDTVRRKLDTSNASVVSSTVAHPMAAALTPDALIKVQQAAVGIRSPAYGRSPGSLADFGDDPGQPTTPDKSAPSKITLEPDAAKQATVVVPASAAQPGAGNKSNAVAH